MEMAVWLHTFSNLALRTGDLVIFTRLTFFAREKRLFFND